MASRAMSDTIWQLCHRARLSLFRLDVAKRRYAGDATYDPANPDRHAAMAWITPHTAGAQQVDRREFIPEIFR